MEVGGGEGGGGGGIDDRRTCNSIGCWGHRTEGEDASRFCPLPLMTERPKQNCETGLGMG